MGDNVDPGGDRSNLVDKRDTLVAKSDVVVNEGKGEALLEESNDQETKVSGGFSGLIIKFFIITDIVKLFVDGEVIYMSEQHFCMLVTFLQSAEPEPLLAQASIFVRLYL